MAYSLTQGIHTGTRRTPAGPLGMGAYSIQLQSRFFASYLLSSKFSPTSVVPSSMPTVADPASAATLDAISVMIHYCGIFIALLLIGHGTFWLIEAISSVLYRIPKTFN